MEVVEAAAAQLETLKFSGPGSGVDHGAEVQSPDSVPAPGSQPPLQSEEGCPDGEQAVEAQPAGEQPPPPSPSAEAGGSPAPQPAPELPRCGAFITGPAATRLAQTPHSSETWDSDSDRWSA